MYLILVFYKVVYCIKSLRNAKTWEEEHFVGDINVSAFNLVYLITEFQDI